MTLLISIENGFSARYLLRTGVLTKITEAGIPVVVVSPNANEVYFQEQFSQDKILCVLPPSKNSWNVLKQRLDLIRYFGIPCDIPNTNIEIKYQEYLRRHPMRPVFLGLLDGLIKTHRRNRLMRGVVEFILSIGQSSEHRKFLRKHKVRLVVLDGIGYSGPQLALWSYAAKGVYRTFTVVTNFDHPTTKGYRMALSDHYAVWGSSMKDELVGFLDIPKNRISQVGSALFDVYRHPNMLIDRSEICKRFGLDPTRPILLYIGNSPVNFPHNIDMVRYLAENLKQLPNHPQLIVRLHPLFAMDLAKKELETHLQFAESNSGIVYSIPKVNSQELLPDMDINEIIISASLVRSADCMVNWFSTMQLDGCICDIPVVNIGFDWSSGSASTQKASRFEHYIHLKRIVQSGAVSVAHSRTELIACISEGLKNPKKQKNERQSIVHQECGVLDGNAAERLASIIIKEYYSTKVSDAYSLC